MTASGIYEIWEKRLFGDEKAALARIETFCSDVVEPFARNAAVDRLPVSRKLAKAWGGLGMLGLQTPRELGGLGASYFAKISMVQALARRSFACAFSLNNMQSLVYILATRAHEEVRERHLSRLLQGDAIASVGITEPSGGSDLANMRTNATKVSGGWVVSGEKAWITNATICDLMLVSAQTATGTRGIGRFIIDMSSPGVERLPAHPMAVGHAAGLGGAKFDNVFVPDSCMVDAPGEAFRLGMSAINGARTHVAAMCVATLQQSLATAVRYCSDRRAFGKSLLNHQGLKWDLVEVANRLEAANLLTYRAAERIAGGCEAARAAARAGGFAADAALVGVERCMQAMGACAALESTSLVRHLGDLKLAGYADGTTEMQNERIGAFLLEHYTE